MSGEGNQYQERLCAGASSLGNKGLSDARLGGNYECSLPPGAPTRVLSFFSGARHPADADTSRAAAGRACAIVRQARLLPAPLVGPVLARKPDLIGAGLQDVAAASTAD